MKFRIGDVLEICFLDHVSTTNGIAAPLYCRVIGELVNIDRKAFYLASWLTQDNDQHNMDCHTILKSTVKSVEVLRKKKTSRLPENSR